MESLTHEEDMKIDEIFLAAEVLFLPIAYVHNVVDNPSIRIYFSHVNVKSSPFPPSVYPDSSNVQ